MQGLNQDEARQCPRPSRETVDDHVFLTNLSRSPSPIQELGHQSAHPTLTELAKAACKGFFIGMATARFSSFPMNFRTTVPIAFGIDTLISDFSKELSYDHEYARETWEHEYNSIGEVDEYVSYATGRGLSSEKARNIALSVTSEPSVSVPYHLAFELGLVCPSSYRRKVEHVIAVGLGYFIGISGAQIAISLSSRLDLSDERISSSALLPISFLIMTPALFLRYRHLHRVHRSQDFKLFAFGAYSVALALLVYVNK